MEVTGVDMREADSAHTMYEGGHGKTFRFYFK